MRHVFVTGVFLMTILHGGFMVVLSGRVGHLTRRAVDTFIARFFRHAAMLFPHVLVRGRLVSMMRRGAGRFAMSVMLAGLHRLDLLLV